MALNAGSIDSILTTASAAFFFSSLKSILPQLTLGWRHITWLPPFLGTFHGIYLQPSLPQGTYAAVWVVIRYIKVMEKKGSTSGSSSVACFTDYLLHWGKQGARFSKREELGTYCVLVAWAAALSSKMIGYLSVRRSLAKYR